MKRSFFLGCAFLLSGQFIHSSQGKTEFPIKMLKNAWNAAASYLPSDRLTALNYSSVPVVIGTIIFPFLVWGRKEVDWHVKNYSGQLIDKRGFAWLIQNYDGKLEQPWAAKAVKYLPFIVTSLYAAVIIKLNQPFANSSDFVVNCNGERIPFESMYKTPTGVSTHIFGTSPVPE